MYSSLQRVDLSATANAPTRPMVSYILSDHRDADAIQSEPALSVIFAITRCLVAHRLARDDGARSYRVEYQLPSEPPAFFRHVVTAAGASIVPGRTRRSELADLVPRDAELVPLIADACKQLAAATWKRLDFEPSVAGLAAYEHALRHTTYDEGETEYYEAIVTLGSLAASLLVERGLDWRAGGSVVPFLLGGANHRSVDVFGAAQSYLDRLPDKPSTLLGSIRGEPLDDGHPFTAFTRRTGIPISGAELASRVLAGRPDDAAGRALAQELALEAAEALRRWGVEIADQVTWVEEPVADIDIDDVIGEIVIDLVDLAHRGQDGVGAICDKLEPLDEAIREATRRRGYRGSSLKDCWRDCRFRSAARLQLRVPSRVRRVAGPRFTYTMDPFAGARFADTPNPFAPLASVLATGYLVEINEDGIKLIVPIA